ncbi:MAG: ATP-binding protein, partial [Deltaproteobacteria bacterium]|nr:ATP-binding protein [Deltaproteobacteria bacterium]
MLAKVLSSAVIGIDAYIVNVEVDISQGLPSFSTVGLPEGAVRESKERVRTAIRNSGYHFPSDRITVNLAPADIKKEGTAFDLPMALGILAGTGLVSPSSYAGHLVLGEMALDGLVRPIKGVLPMAIAAKEQGLAGIYLPAENAPEASVVGGIKIYPLKSLSQLIEALSGIRPIEPFSGDNLPFEPGKEEYPFDFSDVCGQESVKRAMEIAAAG